MIEFVPTIIRAVLILILSQIALHADDLAFVPHDSVAVISIQKSELFANEIEQLWISLNKDPEFKSLVVGDPFPVIDNPHFAHVSQLVSEAIELTRELDSVTVFVTRLSPAIEFGAVVTTKGSVENYIDRLSSLLIDIKELNVNVNQNEVERLFLDQRKLVGMFQGLAGMGYEIIGKKIVLSNSSSLRARIVACMNNQRPEGFKSMVTSRRYVRAMVTLGDLRRFAAIAYVSEPALFFDIMSGQFDRAALDKMGFKELVSSAVAIELSNDRNNDMPVFTVHCNTPFTVPIDGVTAHWNSFKTIEKVAILSGLQKVSSGRTAGVEVSAIDRNEYFETRSRMFTEAEKEEDYAREIAKDVSFSGNEELFKSFYSGTKVKYWYEPFGRVGGAGLVTFFEIPNKQLALDYVRAMVDKENAQVRFKYQPVTVAENDSWFMSEEDARNNAEYSFGKELVSQFPDLIINRGFVVTDKWLIIGEKRLIEPYLEEFGNQTNNLNDEVSRIFSGSNMVLDREAPVWLRLDFGINRLDEVAMCRVNYFSSKMPLRDARKKVYVDRQKLPDLAPFEVESENDRSYLLFERILIGIVGRYQSNITSFSKSSDCLFWKYHTFLK